ncbi:MAG TPA: CinA family protein [Gammaproteobacteria bacterium]
MAETDEELFELASDLGKALVASGMTVACAESCTGGWIAKAITDVPGSSDWFGWGVVTYANAAKIGALGVAPELLAAHGAVSEPVVRAMAEGVLRVSGADVSVAVSGVAGPDGGTSEKPVGTVWIAWARGSGVTTINVQFDGDRESVRRQTVAAALRGLHDVLRNDD